MKIWRRKSDESAVPIIRQLGVLSDKLKEVIGEIDDITKQMRNENRQRGANLKDMNHGRM